MEITCEQFKKFRKEFFVDRLSVTLTDHILAHLLTCQACLDYYKSIAVDYGLTFNIKERALNFVVNGSHGKKCYKNLTKQKLIELGFANDIKARQRKWTNAANYMKISKLMNLKAFEDFMNDELDVDENSADELIQIINNYAKWYAKKICPIIDDLEICYALEMED